MRAAWWAPCWRQRALTCPAATLPWLMAAALGGACCSSTFPRQAGIAWPTENLLAAAQEGSKSYLQPRDSMSEC